jgi:mannobiose 2-epimerase
VWTISAEGGHKETNKLIYLQGFGIYALAEFHRATGDTRALARSIAIYELIEKHARDRASGGYHDALGRRWDRLGTAQHYLLGSARKSQNSHVHILEAYTNLLRVWADPNLRANQRELMGVLMNHVIDRRTYHSKLFLTEDWRPIGDRVSHGHDIELSWLLSEAADVLKDSRLIAEVKPIALNIASVTMAEGVDSDGGVINESGPNGYTDTDKNWWSQAEATVGFFNAYQISGDPRYFEASRRSWNYIEAKFVDRLHGDWIEKVRRDGRPIRRPKVTLWKCPYHSSRSCLELIERAREQVGGAPAR